MTYIGIDFHKKYSVASSVDESGRIVKEGRIEGNTKAGFERYFGSLGFPCKVVIEACWNWGYIFDLLEDIPQVQEVILANPYKTRIIAEAQIKTDKIDARTLAQLLRAGLIPQAHIPSQPVRQRKNILRQRQYWVRMRTKLRNRVHALLDRQRGLEMPQVTDLFGSKGKAALKVARLPEPDRDLLGQDLEVLNALDKQIRENENYLREESGEDIELLESIPGIGRVLSQVISAEIDEIGRFPTSAKLCAYAGLVPTTHSSGGKEYHGKLLSKCNKWLRWAFVEAAWVAVGCSPYFGSLYRHYRSLGKPGNKTIMIAARRMCQIVWRVLSEKKPYEERMFLENNPGCSQARLAV